MKYINKLTVTFILVLIIAAINFANTTAEMKSKSPNLMNRQTTGQKTIKPRRHKIRRGTFGNLTPRQRTHRLTANQRRYYNNALRNIFIN